MIRRRSLTRNLGEAPIMSFQTVKNGTFDPIFALDSGTLKWIIDGVEYITNTPSVALTGSIVDVKVYANTVPLGEVATNIRFDGRDIIGEESFEYFTINGSLWSDTNPFLTSIKFSTFSNNPTILVITNVGLTTIDLTNVTPQGSVFLSNNTFLTEVIVGGLSTAIGLFREDGSALLDTSIDGTLLAMDTFYSVNPPIKNMDLRMNGGTNASPTNGINNAALVNLRDVVYPNAGFTFTALIN